jgi:hypothetical protein
LIVPLMLSASACAAVHYTIHPGALNQADSVTYQLTTPPLHLRVPTALTSVAPTCVGFMTN